MKNREHVLKLIPESKGPAGLVKTASAKDPAGQGLIKQPAVGEDVQCVIRRAELYGAQDRCPVLLYAFKGKRGRPGAGELLQELDRLAGIRGATQPKNDFFLNSV